METDPHATAGGVRSEHGLRSLRRRGWAAARAALALVGSLMVLASATPFVSWYAAKLGGTWSCPPGDILIVLGGPTVESGGRHMLGAASYWRCIGAVHAFQSGRFQQVVTTGVHAAAPMRDFLITLGVPAAAIRLQPYSLSTREDALFTSRMLAAEAGRKVLLTSEYHMFRARRSFSRAGLDVLEWPTADAGKGGFIQRWPAFLELIRETVKITYYDCRGWI